MKNWHLLALCLISSRALAADPGVTDKDIYIGSHTTESGVLGIYAPLPHAMDAYFDMINKQGGVDGRKIHFTHIDTQGDFAKTSQAVRKLVEQDNVFAIVGGMGSFHSAAYKYLIDKKIPDVLVYDAASIYTNPPNKYVFPSAFSWTDEAKGYGDYVIKHFAGKKACLLVTLSPQGEEFTKTITSMLTDYNKTAPDKAKITMGPTQSLDRMALQADSEANVLMKEKCDVVVTTTTGQLGAKTINYAFQQGYKPQWITYWFNANDKFVSLVNEGAREGIIASTSIAMGENLKTPGWAKYKKLMEDNNLVISGVTTYGYYFAEFFVEVLKRAAAQGGHDLTREKFLAAAENIKDWQCDLCLDKVNTSPTNHWPQRPTLIVVKNGQWNILKDTK